MLSRTYPAAHAQETEVFWFLFSKKNALPSSPQLIQIRLPSPTNHRPHHPPEPLDSRPARLPIRRYQLLPLPLEQGTLQRRPALRQPQQPLPAIRTPCADNDKVPFGQRIQHPRQALLGDAQRRQQIRHRHSRSPRDEMQRTVMRTAKPGLFQHWVHDAGEITPGEKKHVLCQPDLFFSQEEKARSRLARRFCVRHVSPAPSGRCSVVSFSPIECVAPTPSTL